MPELLDYVIACCAIEVFGLPKIAFDSDSTTFNDAYREIAEKAAKRFSVSDDNVLKKLHSAWKTDVIDLKQ